MNKVHIMSILQLSTSNNSLCDQLLGFFKQAQLPRELNNEILGIHRKLKCPALVSVIFSTNIQMKIGTNYLQSFNLLFSWYKLCGVKNVTICFYFL